jgi:hypothetical protein
MELLLQFTMVQKFATFFGYYFLLASFPGLYVEVALKIDLSEKFAQSLHEANLCGLPCIHNAIL